MANLKLAFTDWYFCNFVIQIKLCKIRYLNLEKPLLFPRKQVICLKNLKLWQAPTTVEFIFFSWDFTHASYLTMSTKGCFGYLKILFGSCVINENAKNECVETKSL